MKVYDLINYILLKHLGIKTATAEKAGVEVYDVYVGKKCGFCQYRKGIRKEDSEKLESFLKAQEDAKKPRKPHSPEALEKRRARKELKAALLAKKEQQEWEAYCDTEITKNPEVLALAKKCSNRDVMTDLIEELTNINDANVSWVRDAYRGLVSSLEHKGIYRDYKSGLCDLDFYSMVCKAINAYRRHAYTDYDDIDKRGMDDYQIAELRREKTIEAKK